MSERDTRIPEERNGIEVGEMDADYDEGDKVPGALDTTEITASFEATWRHNTGEIYKGTSSAIDEALGNAITAVRRAQKMFDAWNAGVFVRIEERSEGEVYLTIRDEGIGMSKEFIDNVLSDIGTTTGLVGEKANSKFGRGFFALYMLVGESRKDASGSFVMSTNPRIDTNDDDVEPPYNVIFQPGKLSYVETHSAALDGDSYGTRLRFCVRDGISADDIEQWVRDYGVYSRTPIMIERINPDGSMDNDELGGKMIEDNYEDSSKVVVEEKGLYRAVASPDAEGKVVILDAQTDTNSNMSFSLYSDWNIDIRLLSEDGPIYDSSDESKIGKIPIDKDEIEDVPENKREQYIPREQYDEYSDKRLDEPSGTRDIIELSDEFLKQVSTKIEQKFMNRLENALSNISSPSDWNNLSQRQSNLVGSIISRRNHKWNIYDLIDDETKKLLRNLSRNFYVVEEGSSIRNPKDISSRNKESKRAYELQQEYDKVYYGHSILPRRANAVWSDGNNAVIKTRPDKYDVCEYLGWTKITTVTSKSVEDMDVNDDVVEQFKKVYQSNSKTRTGVSDNYDDRELTVHHKNYSSTITTTIGQIRDHFGDNPDDYESNLDSIGQVVVFTSTSEHSISHNKNITDEYTATCKCVNKVFEEKLSHLDNVFKYEDYGNHGKEDYTILTSEGNITISDLSKENFRIFHVTESQKNILKEMQEASDVDVLSNLLEVTDPVAVMTKIDLCAIRPHIEHLRCVTRQNGYTTAGDSFKICQPNSSVCIKFTEQLDGWESLVSARLPEWSGKPELVCAIDNYADESREVQKNLLEKYGRMHDQGLETSSDKNKEVNSDCTLDMTLNTNRGEMSVRDIKNSDDQFVVFPLTNNVEEVMREVPVEVVEEYINNNVSERRYSQNKVFSEGEYIVAMVSYEKIERLTEQLKIYAVRPRRSPTVPRSRKQKQPCRYYTELYGYYKSKESNADKELIMTAKDSRLIDEGYHLINSLVGN